MLNLLLATLICFNNDIQAPMNYLIIMILYGSRVLYTIVSEFSAYLTISITIIIIIVDVYFGKQILNFQKGWQQNMQLM